MSIEHGTMNEIISVIIPIYNTEKYLEECLTSVCKQTYTNLEILLINDGSTDNSLSICNRFLKFDKRIRIINKKNGGLSDARNEGIEKAIGKWFVFVDSDDVLHKKAIELLYYAVKKSNAMLAVGMYCDFQENIIFKEYNEECNLRLLSTEEALQQLLIEDQGRWVTACWKIYNCSLFEHIRYPKNRIYEDTYVMHLLLEKAKKIAVIDNVVYYYRKHEHSIMGQNGFRKKDDLYLAYILRIDFLREKGYTTLYQNQKNFIEWLLHKDYILAEDKAEKKKICKIYRIYYWKNFKEFNWRHKIAGLKKCVLKEI